MTDIDQRFIRAFILLGRQYAVTQYVAVRRKPRVLSAFEAALRKKKQSLVDVLRVYELVFSLVDNICRYQKIAGILPKFGQKTPEFRKFTSGVDGMKELRNLLQHINGDIDTEFESPLLGGVTWVKGQTNYIACFQEIGDKRSVPGLVLDTHTGRFTKEFCYVHDGKYYDLALAFRSCREYQRHVESRAHVSIDGRPYQVKEHFGALGVSFLSRADAERAR